MEITRHGTPQQTNGNPPALEAALPAFTVFTADNQTFDPHAFAGRYNLISVVPDINTRVCSISTKQFNQSMENFTDVGFYTISTNTIQQQQNWCAAEGVDRIQLLADPDGSFGKAMGLYVAENNTNARSVWIIDPTGKISYRELILEQTDEPNYAAALAFLKAH
ncbi:peroxiredoxin [Lacticaseibacillus baoqingensis]|uniref:Peroxiredoxin n=1 Tax=Lacticaseibacillus baoqingensis TaxID=2486013 RepID=A0ABW4E2V0_9LACO|nr:peroxiredoxin [Lacticaseibacillus baoqingensis]